MHDYYGTRDELLSEIAHRQRKLIPLNIVVAVLAIVAALTIMFSPLISIDMSNYEEVLSEFLGDSDDGSSDEGNSDEDDENGYTSIISSLLSEITGEKFSLTTYTLLTFSFSDDPVKDLTTTISTKIADALTEYTDTLITEVVIPTIVETVSEETDIEIDADKVNSVLDAFDELGAASDNDEVDDAIYDLFKALQEIVGTDVLTDDIYQSKNEDEDGNYFYDIVYDIYEKTTEKTEDGTFSIESFISVYVSEEVLGNEDEVYTSYSDLINSVLNNYMSDLGEMIEENIDIVKYVALAISAFAGVWGILFLAAFIRIFTRNKRFTMWYVKLFGFIPCLLFFVLPLAVPTLLESVLGASIPIINTIFGMISSTTWISGACYIALWIVSIFWAFPIKRKIRACKRELRAMN